MQKIMITVGILIFILATVFVLSVDSTTNRKKVQFTNQNFIINNENTDIASENVKLNLAQTNTTNTNITLNQTDLNMSNSQDTDFSNKSIDYNNTETDYQTTNYSNPDTEYDSQLTDYDRQKSRIRAIEQSIAQQRNTSSSQRLPERKRYVYRDIDWSTWKSEFINKILDDSMEIKSLDDYGVGSWFYYSFTVTSTGEIKDIQVTSMHLSKDDKEKVKQLIRGYAHEDITVFPADSRKTRTKVDAIMMLGTTEKKSKPSDFNEKEKVKFLLPN